MEENKEKDCNNCKFDYLPDATKEPCSKCDFFNNWEPKEEVD